MSNVLDPLADLRRANAELAAARKAALNLMEDAILARDALQEREARLARELEDTKRLQRVSGLLITDESDGGLAEPILDAAVAVMRADFGSIQAFDADRGELRLLAWRNFHPDSAAYWRAVTVGTGTTCGSALRHGERVIVPDVEADAPLRGTESLRHYRLSGIAAVQSTPLTTRSGRLIGMISTHWREAHAPGERELRLLDILARQAADYFERRGSQAALRASEERQAFLLKLSDALRPLADPGEITATAARVLGERLGVNRAFYAAVDGEDWLLVPGYETGVVPLPNGRYPIAVYGRWLLDLMRAGERLVVRDVGTDPRYTPAQREGARAFQVAGEAAVPLVKDGELLAAFVLHAAAPREWSEHDLGLLAETAERTWAALERARAEAALAAEKEYAESIVQTLHEPLLVLHPNLTVRSVNPAFYTHFRVDPADTVGRKVYELGNGQWDIPALRTLLEDVLPDSNVFNDYEVTHEFEGIGRRVMLVNGRRLDHVQLVLLGIRDITERARAEAALRASEEKYKTLFTNMGEGFALAEVIRDAAGNPADWRYLEVNDAWTAQTGVPVGETVGRTAREVNPRIEPGWIETYGRVADTRQPARYESYAGGFGRWFETFAFRHSENRFALLFRDVSDRKRADEALRASEEKYKTLFESMDEAYAVVELIRDDAAGRWTDFRFLEVNPAFVKHTGMPYPVGRTATELLGTPNPRWAETYGRVAETGEPVRMEEREPTLDRVFDLFIFRLGGPGSRRVAVLFTDVTTRKRTEAALRASEERLRLALSAARMGTWTWDVAADVHTRDANLNALLGLPAEETTRPLAEFLDHVHPADRAAVQTAFDESVRRGRPLGLEFRVVRPDGGVRWFRDQGDVFGTAGQVRLAGAVVDVTDRRETEDRLRLVLASATDYAIFTLGPDRTVTSWSPGAAAVLGWPAAEMLGRSADDIFTPEDRAAGAPEREADTARRDGRSADERWHVRKDGSRFYASGVMTLLGDPSRGFVKVLRDLTDKKRAEDDLRAARADLERRVAERTAELEVALDALEGEMARRQGLTRRLAAAAEAERRRVSRELHDSVGQLLTGLSLAAKAARGAGPLPPAAAGKLDDVLRLSEAIGKELHALAVRLRPTALDDVGLGAAVGQLVAEWSARAGVTVDYQATGLEPDRLQPELETTLYRVVQEALTNVAKHAAAGRVAVILTRLGAEATAVIEDDGAGFDPATAGKGRLGLVGMRERLALVGGTLEVESAPGSGTTVIARVPLGGDRPAG